MAGIDYLDAVSRAGDDSPTADLLVNAAVEIAASMLSPILASGDVKERFSEKHSVFFIEFMRLVTSRVYDYLDHLPYKPPKPH